MNSDDPIETLCHPINHFSSKRFLCRSCRGLARQKPFSYILWCFQVSSSRSRRRNGIHRQISICACNRFLSHGLLCISMPKLVKCTTNVFKLGRTRQKMGDKNGRISHSMSSPTNSNAQRDVDEMLSHRWDYDLSRVQGGWGAPFDYLQVDRAEIRLQTDSIWKFHRAETFPFCHDS